MQIWHWSTQRFSEERLLRDEDPAHVVKLSKLFKFVASDWLERILAFLGCGTSSSNQLLERLRAQSQESFDSL